MCSKVAELLEKSLEVSTLHKVRLPSAWTVAHVGGFDAFYRIAEISDVFGAHEHGTKRIGELLYRVRKTSGTAFCGTCCECVWRETEASMRRSYRGVLLLPSHTEVPVDAVKGLGPHVKILPVPSNPIDAKCSEKFTVKVIEALRELRSIDILTLDAFRCDVDIVLEGIVTAEIPSPSLLEFTLVKDVSYETVVNKLAAAGYVCYYMTTKPEHKRFRGIRQPVYPIAVPVTGCYRGIFDSFKGERYHMVCRHRESNTPWGTVLDAWSRMPHKGMFAGCAAAGRSRRIKEWFK
jgi:hypothetical protein